MKTEDLRCNFGVPPQQRLPNDRAAFSLHHLLRFHGGQFQACRVQLEQPRPVPLMLLTSTAVGRVKLPRQCPRKEVSECVKYVKINHTQVPYYMQISLSYNTWPMLRLFTYFDRKLFSPNHPSILPKIIHK